VGELQLGTESSTHKGRNKKRRKSQAEERRMEEIYKHQRKEDKKGTFCRAMRLQEKQSNKKDSWENKGKEI